MVIGSTMAIIINNTLGFLRVKELPWVIQLHSISEKVSDDLPVSETRKNWAVLVYLIPKFQTPNTAPFLFANLWGHYSLTSGVHSFSWPCEQFCWLCFWLWFFCQISDQKHFPASNVKLWHSEPNCLNYIPSTACRSLAGSSVETE